jgi:diguanylate cyclase (GGDEF)-like protein/PAS domain S-box-containing protein
MAEGDPSSRTIRANGEAVAKSTSRAQAESGGFRRYWPVVAIFSIGVVVALFASVLLQQKNAKDVDAELQGEVEGRIRTMQVGFGRYEDIVSALRTYLSGAGGFPGTAKFNDLASGLLRQYEGVQALVWAPRVTAAGRAEFETRARQSGIPDFHITERTPDGRWIPAGDRAEYFPVIGNKQVRDEQAALGFDEGAEPVRRRTLERARDTAKPAATPAHQLFLPDRKPEWGTLIVWPVYAEGAPTATVDERRAGLIGFAIGVFRIENMLETILDRTTIPVGLDQYFFDGPAPCAAYLIHLHQSRLRTAAQAPAAYDEIADRNGIRKTVSIADRQWTVVSVPTAGKFTHVAPIEIWIVLLVGVAATGLGTLFVWILIRRAEHLRMLADMLSRRDAILDAVATSATELLHSSDPRSVFANVLERVGHAADASRAHLFEVRTAAKGQPVVDELCRWDAPGFAISPEWEQVIAEDMSKIGIGSWVPKLKAEQTITGVVRSFEPPVRTFLRAQGVLAALVIPIFVDGDWWGHVAFDNCTNEREWSAAEIDSVKTLAELVGSSLARAKHIKELSDAGRIIENSSALLYRIEPKPPHSITYISRNVSRYGYTPSELLASPSRYFELVHPDDRAEVLTNLVNVVEGHVTETVGDRRLRTADGRYAWFEAHTRAIYDERQRLVAIEGILIDIDDRKTAEARVEEATLIDAVTGLASRKAFMEQFDRIFTGARRGAAPFAILYLDIDHFKDVNDVLGHTKGDELLKLVAQRLKGMLHPNDLIARFGGDEFAILQSDVLDPSDAGVFAATIIQTIAVPFDIGTEIHITASIGISVYSAESANPEEMIKNVDLALYRAKESGRNQYHFHSDELDVAIIERVTMAGDLRLGIGRGELELYYQPQVETASGKIVGIEALVRWNHPKHGLLYPIRFIPIAERSDIIFALGHWVIEESCRQIAQWRKEDLTPPTLAINVSAAQLKLGVEFERMLMHILQRWGIEPHAIEIELTESVLMAATRENNAVVERLRALDISIAIDDFGTGYSSLNYLRRYRVNRLKIAQEFIADLPADLNDLVIVRAAVSLARELGIEVIAEGVETAAQLNLLTKAGCQYVQGYYFSRPVPAKRAGELLRQGVLTPAPINLDTPQPTESCDQPVPAALSTSQGRLQ